MKGTCSRPTDRFLLPYVRTLPVFSRCNYLPALSAIFAPVNSSTCADFAFVVLPTRFTTYRPATIYTRASPRSSDSCLREPSSTHYSTLDLILPRTENILVIGSVDTTDVAEIGPS
jgi:hypothetical protein